MSLNFRPALRVEIGLKPASVPLHSHIIENFTEAYFALVYQRSLREALRELVRARSPSAYFHPLDPDELDVAIGSHTVNVRVRDGDGITEYAYPLREVEFIEIEE